MDRCSMPRGGKALAGIDRASGFGSFGAVRPSIPTARACRAPRSSGAVEFLAIFLRKTPLLIDGRGSLTRQFEIAARFE